MRTSNKKAIRAMAEFILDAMGVSEVKRYKKEFPFEYDYNIYQYGCLDIYDYNLYLRLVNIGIDTKAVIEYTKILDHGCTYKHRENIRNTYKTLVHNAVKYILDNNKTEVKIII